MRFVLRLLALLLVLTSSGVFQTLALASEEQADCAGEDDPGGCMDCSKSAPCACCPLRALAIPAPVPLPTVCSTGTSVFFSVEGPVAAAARVDIFRPPRG
jgi:hypothetical protein